VSAVGVLDRLHPAALVGSSHDDRRPIGGHDRLLVGVVDRVDVVAVDLDRPPSAGLCAVAVGAQVPAVHGLAALAEAVDVDDRGQVVEVLE
jgi:hypothetical protein